MESKIHEESKYVKTKTSILLEKEVTLCYVCTEPPVYGKLKLVDGVPI